MRTGARIGTAVAATMLVALAAAAYATGAGLPPTTPVPAIGGPPVAITPVPTGPGPVAVAVAPGCRPSELSGEYTLNPFSQGAGHVAYTLTVKNHSSAACSMMTPLPARLLGKKGKPLPTRASTSAGGRYLITLAAGQWAQAASRFSPDVPGPGERSPCEPTAHSLRIGIGGGRSIIAPMDPTPVCERGQIGFDHLIAVAITPACTAAQLTATFKHLGNSFRGAYYGLAFENAGKSACYLDGAPGLRLLDRTGGPLPTREVRSVPYPVVVGPGKKVSALASMASVSRPAVGEPRRAPCEPKATRVRIDPLPGGGLLSTALKPPTTVCRRGLITVSGLLEGYPFS